MQLNLTEEQKIRNQKIGKVVEDGLYFGFLTILSVCILSFLLTGKMTGKPNVLGYRHFYIVSASMEPTIKTSQFVLTETIDAEAVQKDDIIAYKKDNKIIIHRVADIKQDEHGKLLFILKGDNNKDVDPYDITEDMIMYKVIWY